MGPTFKPLNIPKDIGQVKPSPAPALPETSRASPAPVTVVPKLTLAPSSIASTTRAPQINTTPSTPTPQVTGPARTLPPPVPAAPQSNPAPKPQSVPQAVVPVPRAPPATPAVPRPAVPSKEAPRNPAAPSQAAPNNNGFFVFQPFNQKPASAPYRTPVNPNAFQIQPQTQPQPAPQPQRPPQLLSEGGRPVPVQQSKLPPGVFAVPAGQSIPAGAVLVNSQGQPLSEKPPAPSAPKLQFGFQPVSQPQPAAVAQPPRPAPGGLSPFQQIQQSQPNSRPQSVPTTFQQIKSQPPPPPRPIQGGPQPFQQIQSQRLPQPVPQRLPQPAPQRLPQAAPPRLPQVAPQRPPQGGSRPAPFTAFSAGVPPQQLRTGGQIGVQPQRPGPGQFAQFDSRFGPPRPQSPGQLRPTQFQQGQGFVGFGQSQLRGA